MSHRQTPAIGFAAAHWGMLLWAIFLASSFMAAGQVSRNVDPMLLTALRLFFSALMFLPMLLLKNKSPITVKGLLAHSALGLLLAIYFGTLFEALRYTTSVNTAMMYALVPLLTLGCETFVLPGSKLSGRLLPMLTAAIGALMLILKGAAPGELPSVYAVSVYTVGCIAMAIYSPLSQRFKEGSLKGRPPAVMTFWNMLFGALCLFLVCLVTGGWRTLWQVSPSDLFWLVYLAMFGTLATFWLLHRAIGAIPSSTVISYVYLSTLFTALVHWTWLNEPPQLFELAGALLVGVGMFGLIRSSRQPKAVPA